MTVSNENNSISYAGNGVTTDFYFNGSSGFDIYDDSDLLVIVKDDMTEAETTLTLTTDYTVNVSGGYITLVDPSDDLPTGKTLWMIRNIPALQETEFVTGDDFNPETLTQCLDKMTMLLIQVKKVLDRVPALVRTTPHTGLTLPDPVSGHYLRWKTDLSGLENDDGTNGVYAASETLAGKVELATSAETITGTDTERAVTPAGLAAAFATLTSILITAGSVVNSMLANMAQNTIKGRITAGAGAPEDLTYTQVKSIIGLDQVDNKSSSTIRGELTSSNVTTALTFTPENAANKNAASGYAGLDASSKITPSQLKYFPQIYAVEGAETLVVADGVAYMRVPSEWNGLNITAVAATLITAASSSGTPTVQIARGRQANPTSAHTWADVLSTKITIDANEWDSKDATAAAVIDTSKDDLATGDLLRVDVDVSGTGAKGLIVKLTVA